MDEKHLPETGSPELLWNRVIRLPMRGTEPIAEWERVFHAIRSRIQEKDYQGVRGDKQLDFTLFDRTIHDVDLGGHAVARQAFNSVRSIKNMPKGTYLNSWALFCTDVPALRRQPEKANAVTALHSDDRDTTYSENGELDSRPAIIWSPQSALNLGTRIIIPFDFEAEGVDHIPALASSDLFSEEGPGSGALEQGLAEKQFRFLNLSPGIFWFLGAPVIHSRSHLSKEPCEGEAWRYALRLNLGYDPFEVFKEEEAS